MAKKSREKPRREVTRRQLARWQQQRRRQRILFGVGVFIIAAALIIVSTGWYISQYRPLHQIVLKVNDIEFNMDYYIKALKFYGAGQSSYYMYGLADGMPSIIEENELIKQEATELGITVSQDEVNKELESSNPPLSKDYRDFVRAVLLIEKLRDEYFEEQVPVYAEQRHIMAMFLESESQAAEVRAKIEAGEDFIELADELSLDDFSKGKEGDLGWLPEGVLTLLLGSSVPEEYAFNGDEGVLSQPLYDESQAKNVGYWLIKVLERREEPEETHIQAILLGSAEEAEAIRARLEAGEDFATLADEFSQYDSSEEGGGDLGWVALDEVAPVFSEFVSESELGMLSEPIRDEMTWTKGGYWLVKIEDKDDNREIESDNRDLLKAKLLDEWVSSLRDDNEVENYLDASKMAWAILRVMEELE